MLMFLIVTRLYFVFFLLKATIGLNIVMSFDGHFFVSFRVIKGKRGLLSEADTNRTTAQLL